jgi:rhodanese-related sulfurtransferase
MGWSLAGLTCEHGQSRRAPVPSDEGMVFARAAAARVARQFGVARIDQATLARLRAEADTRSLYLLDVRDPSEYAAGHVPGAISAPGGQLVQATDQYVGTLGARLVLIDDREVRAVMTASWLVQMGWKEVFVLAASGNATGWPTPVVLGDPPRDLEIGCDELSILLERKEATVVDLSLSRDYLKAHIPGAWFAIRARLAHALTKIPVRGVLVLTSEDGFLGGLAAPEAAALTNAPVRWLAGGNAAWQLAGHALTAGKAQLADEPLDAWIKPYERSGDTAKAAADYLAWEVDLLPRIARDGSADFKVVAKSD